MVDETNKKTEEPKDPGRRDALTGTIAAALGGMAFVAVSRPAKAFENKEGDKCLTVLFPSGKDHEFDIDYYTKHHIPFVLSLYGDSIRNYEVFQGQPGRDGSPPPFLVMANIWIADEQAYAEASRQHAKDFMPDVKNFTNIKTIGQTNVLYKVIKPK
jgi:uncharacterized protein (TIGR02118 family)